MDVDTTASAQHGEVNEENIAMNSQDDQWILDETNRMEMSMANQTMPSVSQLNSGGGVVSGSGQLGGSGGAGSGLAW